jgi:hypothetical protein
MKLTDILNEIKARPATQPKVDPDKVIEYYIEDLKDHLRRKTYGSERLRLDKRPQLFNPKNYKLVNYTEHFGNLYFGGNEEHIAYHFKYKFTGEIVIVILTKGRPGQADDSRQISDDYWYFYFTDFNGFNRMTRYERVNEIKARRPQPNLLKLIEDNIEFIKKEFIIQRIKSIKLVMNNPQEVEINAVIFIDGDDEDDEMEEGIVFRFLEDAQNDEEFVSDFGHDPDLDYITLTLDGIRVAAIELE